MVNNLTIEKTRMTVDSFMQLKPVSVQRPEAPRAKKLKTILEQGLLPTHLEVGLVEVHFTDNYYRSGYQYIINGNSRNYVWTNYPELIPNEMLYVSVYHAFTREDVETIYRSIDSQDSVETVKDLIGGTFRDLSFEPKSEYVRSGKFATALRHAYSCYYGDRTKINYDKTNFNEIKNKKEFILFKNEIEFLDNIYYSFQNKKDIKEKLKGGGIFAALLIICKKYGTGDPMVEMLIENLLDFRTTKHDGVNGLNDGVSVILIDLYNKYNVIQKNQWRNTSAGNGPILIGNILYCMDNFVNHNLIKINSTTSAKGVIMKDEKIIEYFVNYFKTDATSSDSLKRVKDYIAEHQLA